MRRAQKVRAGQLRATLLLCSMFCVLYEVSTAADIRMLHSSTRPGKPEMTNETPPAGALSFSAAAAALTTPVESDGFPPPNAWDRTAPIHFDSDWQGKNADPQRSTETRLLWSTTALYIKFVARYRELSVFADADRNGRRDKLWDRDVAEVFLQPDPSHLRRYKEFEVSPNGLWIDLDIDNGGLQDLKSGLHRRVSINEQKKAWTAELAIPMQSLLPQFDPHAVWRVNFYRVEGPSEPRFYSAWRPTNTPQPNFHVPEVFGYLKFESSNP
jgi:alpha-galactosidase